MPKFMVHVIKTETYSAQLIIEAPSMAQAESMAEDDAREKELDWSYEETEWSSWADSLFDEVFDEKA